MASTRILVRDRYPRAVTATAAATVSERHPNANERKEDQCQVGIVDFHTDSFQYGSG
jgi:hypothetical protein